MEKKLNPRMIEYSVEIKTKKELPNSGFDGVVVRLIGTRDSSNPIAINGMYTGKHQLFTVTLRLVFERSFYWLLHCKCF